MGNITPVIEFSTELADLFDMKGKVAYLPGGYGGAVPRRYPEGEGQLVAIVRGVHVH